MKKILCALFLSFLISYTAIADTDFSQAIQSSSMPTDEEIMNIISKFNFNEEQKKIIFKDTKKKLQEMYSMENIDQTNAELNQDMKVMNHEGLSEYVSPSVTNEVSKKASGLPTTNATNYSSLDLSTIPQDKEGDAAAAEKFRRYGSNKR